MGALVTYIARLPAELHELVRAPDASIREAAPSLEMSVRLRQSFKPPPPCCVHRTTPRRRRHEAIAGSGPEPRCRA